MEGASAFVNVLAGISSLKELTTLVTSLETPIKVALYGSVGVQIGEILSRVIYHYLQERDDKILKELLETEKQLLYVNIHVLRENAFSYLENVYFHRTILPGYTLPRHLQAHETDSENLVKMISPICIEELPFLEEVRKLGRDIFDQLYQKELKNEDINAYLDRIDSAPNNIDRIVEYVVYHPQWTIKKSDRPKPPRETVNYRSLLNLYGEEIITEIMVNLAAQFKIKGGDALYYVLVNSFENSAHEFYQYVSAIAQKDIDSMFSCDVGSREANQLAHYYHGTSEEGLADSAKDHIVTTWNATKWEEYGHSTPPTLKLEMIEIIRIRALMEFCKDIAPYFFAPYNMPREVFNGAMDFPKAIWQVARHPIDSACAIGTTFFTLNGLKGLGNGLYNHPTRMTTTFLTSVGVSASIGVVVNPLHAKATAASAALHHKAQMLAAAHTAPAAATPYSPVSLPSQVATPITISFNNTAAAASAAAFIPSQLAYPLVVQKEAEINEELSDEAGEEIFISGSRSSKGGMFSPARGRPKASLDESFVLVEHSDVDVTEESNALSIV